MTDSEGTVFGGEQGSLEGLAGSIIVPHRGGKDEDALQDPVTSPVRASRGPACAAR